MFNSFVVQDGLMKQKFYVVWQGAETGIFTSWEECKSKVIGHVGAKYKSFKTLVEAQEAFDMGFDAYKELKNEEDPLPPAGTSPSMGRELRTQNENAPAPAINESIAVDAACSGNPGAMEYRGVYLRTGKEIFHYGPVYGTNNIGEFLAIVHGLALLKQKGLHNMPLYSDSVNAQKWVRARKCRTKLERNEKTEQLYQLIERAENWLKTNTYANPILKWPTDEWGEIPADFGRK